MAIMRPITPAKALELDKNLLSSPEDDLAKLMAAAYRASAIEKNRQEMQLAREKHALQQALLQRKIAAYDAGINSDGIGRVDGAAGGITSGNVPPGVKTQVMTSAGPKGLSYWNVPGSTEDEREANLQNMIRAEAVKAVAGDAAFQEALKQMDGASVRKQTEILTDLRRNHIKRLSEESNIDPSILTSAALGDLEARIGAQKKAVNQDSGFWDALLDQAHAGFIKLGGAIKAIGKDGNEANAVMDEAITEAQAVLDANKFIQDQQRMEAEGYGTLDRISGNKLGALGNLIGSTTADLGVEFGLGAAGTALGSLAGPAGSIAGGIAGSTLASTLTERAAFLERAASDKTQTEEQQAENIESGIGGATALGAALGAIPFNVGRVGRVVGDAAVRAGIGRAGREVAIDANIRAAKQNSPMLSVMVPNVRGATATEARQEAFEAYLKRRADADAKRGWLGRGVRGAVTGGIEGALMSAGSSLGQNALYGGITDQDIALTEGLGGSVYGGGIAGAVFGGLLGMPRLAGRPGATPATDGTGASALPRASQSMPVEPAAESPQGGSEAPSNPDANLQFTFEDDAEVSNAYLPAVSPPTRVPYVYPEPPKPIGSGQIPLALPWHLRRPAYPMPDDNSGAYTYNMPSAPGGYPNVEVIDPTRAAFLSTHTTAAEPGFVGPMPDPSRQSSGLLPALYTLRARPAPSVYWPTGTALPPGTGSIPMSYVGRPNPNRATPPGVITTPPAPVTDLAPFGYVWEPNYTPREQTPTGVIDMVQVPDLVDLQPRAPQPRQQTATGRIDTPEWGSLPVYASPTTQGRVDTPTPIGLNVTAPNRNSIRAQYAQAGVTDISGTLNRSGLLNTGTAGGIDHLVEGAFDEMQTTIRRLPANKKPETSDAAKRAFGTAVDAGVNPERIALWLNSGTPYNKGGAKGIHTRDKFLLKQLNEALEARNGEIEADTKAGNTGSRRSTETSAVEANVGSRQEAVDTTDSNGNRRMEADQPVTTATTPDGSIEQALADNRATESRGVGRADAADSGPGSTPGRNSGELDSSSGAGADDGRNDSSNGAENQGFDSGTRVGELQTGERSGSDTASGVDSQSQKPAGFSIETTPDDFAAPTGGNNITPEALPELYKSLLDIVDKLPQPERKAFLDRVGKTQGSVTRALASHLALKSFGDEKPKSRAGLSAATKYTGTLVDKYIPELNAAAVIDPAVFAGVDSTGYRVAYFERLLDPEGTLTDYSETMKAGC